MEAYIRRATWGCKGPYRKDGVWSGGCQTACGGSIERAELHSAFLACIPPCKDGSGQGERREDEQGEEVGDDPASGDPAEGFLEDLGDDVAEQEHEDQRLVGTKIHAVALQHFALVNLRVRRVSTEAIGGQEQQDAGHKLINQS